MTVAGVLCLVDREQGGRDNIERALAEVPSDTAPPFLSVYTATDVRRAHLALNGQEPPQLISCYTFLNEFHPHSRLHHGHVHVLPPAGTCGNDRMH